MSSNRRDADFSQDSRQLRFFFKFNFNLIVKLAKVHIFIKRNKTATVLIVGTLGKEISKINTWFISGGSG